MQTFRIPFLISNDKYGKTIPGLKIHGQPAPYPVVNEREVRVVAGTMFTIGFATFFSVAIMGQTQLLLPVVLFFLTEFLLKVWLGPGWSPISWATKWLVSNQKPEYVGAIQKRFAWTMGIIMATLMILLTQVFSAPKIIPLSICGLCLTLMWLESVVGYCAGCTMYSRLVTMGIIKQPKIKPACPGGVCAVTPRRN